MVPSGQGAAQALRRAKHLQPIWKYMALAVAGFGVLLTSYVAVQAPRTPHAKAGPITRGARRQAFEVNTARCSPELYNAWRRSPSNIPIEKLCEPYPWLLPPRAPAFSYSGVSEETQLLQARSQPIDRHKATLSVFVFTRAMAALAQNYVYTLVKFAAVTNYIAATGGNQDYEACLDLNLPCWDASRFLPVSLKGSEGDALHGTAQYNAITWWKPRVVAHLVQQGYAVHMSDVDIAYSTKPLWQSYLRYIDDVGADGAMARATGNVPAHLPIGLEATANTGNYVVLPTPGGQAFMAAWAAAWDDFSHVHDQNGLALLRNATQGASHAFCWHPPQCAAAKRAATTPLLRLYSQSWLVAYPDNCWLGNQALLKALPLDPCHWTMLYIHTVCMKGSARKMAALKAAGFWFLDDASCVGGQQQEGQLPRCQPLAWRDPGVEEEFLRCREHPLAFTYIPFRERDARGEVE